MAVPPAPGAPAGTAPPLETARLRLRAHRPSDHAACAAIWADPGVVRFLGGHPLGGEDAWRRLLQYAGLWSFLGYGYWAVEEKASGRYVGDVGCADFHRGLVPSLDGMLEFGWVLAPAVHGRGYASEAVTAVLAWAARQFPGRPAACIIAPDNAASLHVAARTGFRPVRETTCHGEPVTLFLRPDDAGDPP